MAKTQYLEYSINLTDKSEVATLQAAYPSGILIAPNAAALAYLAPIQLVTDPHPNPGTRSAHFILANPNNYDRNVASFQRKSGGWFGLSFLFGTTTTFIWVGKFFYAPSTTPTLNESETEEVPIAKRKWFVGFEGLATVAGVPEIAHGAAATTGFREASRHADGMGFYSYQNTGWEASPTASGDALSNKVWERFYFKMITAPTGDTRMHRTVCSGGVLRGASVNMKASRQIVINQINNAGVETAIGTTTMVFELNTWYRLDLLTEIKDPGGNIRLYVNRQLKLTAVASSGVGIGNNDTHSMSVIGPVATHGAANTFQCYFDDWIGSEWPHEDSLGRYVGLDWLNGSRVRHIPAVAFATGNNFTGDYRYANQWTMAAAGVDAASELISVVSGDALRLLVDDKAINSVPGSIGAVAFEVTTYGRQQVAGQGMLGWKYNGTVDLAAQTDELTTVGWSRRWNRPSGETQPIANLTPLELHKVKASNANQCDIFAAGVTVELIGVFGEEDIALDETSQPETLPPRRGLHNAPYPTTMWARSSLPPISPVVIHTGTYVGNGTVKELTFRCPVGWLMVRRISGTSQGSFWFSSMVSGHPLHTVGVDVGFVQAGIDPTFVSGGAEDDQEQQTRVRIMGADAGWNTNGETYQYVAFEDPGARYHLNGAYQITSTAFATKDVPLANSDFVPLYGFYHHEAPGSVDGAFGAFVKGPGHAANAASDLSAAENAVMVTHAAGLLTVRAGLMEATGDRVHSYSLWRKDDQSTDPNKLNVVAIGSYVGDGVSPRNIVFGTSGKRPAYAIVTPHNAQSIHRDPSALTDKSYTMGGGLETATGITGGDIDTFTVGATLNAGGVTYEYFVLIGGTAACNGGWSCNGEFTVVEPDSPSDGDYDDPDDALPPADDDADPDPGPGDGDDCDAGAACVAATTRMVNLALLKIGVQHFLTDYCTQDVKEAQVARQVFETAVRYTLRSFPWPFATKYAALALASAQPSNEDWTYAYRVPTDCIYPRRLVVARNKALDPKGPPFMLSSDTSGGILFSNQASPTLEYTARPNCVSYVADALFTEALAWKLGAEMAPGLSRMTEVVAHCLEQFKVAIEKAEADIKPSVPGKVPAADPADLDTTATQITANVQVINRALLRIGARPIANYTTDQSSEAIAARLVFEDELQATLRDYPWSFATKYHEPTLVGGTSSTPVNLDWQYSYRLPSDCVMVRRLVTALGRSYERNPDLFRAAEDATGGLLYAMTDDPTIEYTAREAGTVVKSDAKFRDALAWRLAAAVAPALAQIDPEAPQQHGRGPEMPQDGRQRNARKDTKAMARFRIAQWAWLKYQEVLESAKTTDANEKQDDKPGDADWILDR